MATHGGRDGFLSRHPLVVAVVVYAAVCVPVYLWLEGPVGLAGTVDESVAAASLVTGSIMIVPVLKAGVRRVSERGVEGSVQPEQESAATETLQE